MSYTRILVRRGTTSEWTASDPILAEGEIGIDTTEQRIKIGDGTSPWSEVPFLVSKEIASAAFDGDDIVFTKDDSTTVTLADAAITLRGQSGSPAGAYANLAALNAANPDHASVYVTLDDGKWCYYDTGTSLFVAGGTYQAAAISEAAQAEIDELQETLLTENIVPNGDFSSTDNMTLTNAGGGTLERSTTQFKIGTHSLYLLQAAQVVYMTITNATLSSHFAVGDVIYIGAWAYIVTVPVNIGVAGICRMATSSNAIKFSAPYDATLLNEWQYASAVNTYAAGDYFRTGRLTADTSEYYLDGLTILNLTEILGADIASSMTAAMVDELLLAQSVDYWKSMYTKPIEMPYIHSMYNDSKFPNYMPNGDFSSLTDFTITQNAPDAVCEQSDTQTKVGAQSLYIMQNDAVANAVLPSSYIDDYFEDGDIMYIGAWAYIITVPETIGLNGILRLTYSSNAPKTTVPYDETVLNAWQYASVIATFETGNKIIMGRYSYAETCEFYISGLIILNLSKLAGNPLLSAVSIDSALLHQTDYYWAQTYYKLPFITNIAMGIDIGNIPLSGVLLHDAPTSKSILNTIKRAKQFTDVQWMPIAATMPANSITTPYYAINVVRTGLPYSATRGIGMIIGYEVSLHTFMTAIKNPLSVLYTEDLKPLIPTLAACYYGTVCSPFVFWSKDMPFEYTDTREIPLIDGIMVVEDQSEYGVRIGDMMNNANSGTNGHVMLVTDIVRDVYGKVQAIEIAQSSGIYTHRKYYTVAQFLAYLNATPPYVLYRLDTTADYEASDYVAVDDETPVTVEYNTVLGLDRGDMTNYPLLSGSTTVKYNIMSEDAATLKIKRDGSLIDSVAIVSTGVIEKAYTNCGDYEAYCEMDDLSDSDSVFFKVSEVTVTAPGTATVDVPITVEFTADNTTPLAIVIRRQSDHHKLIIPQVTLTAEEIAAGEASVTIDQAGDLYIKVLGMNDYGGTYSAASNITVT